MSQICIRGFLYSAGIVLLGTGAAKVLSALSGGPVLATLDPVFGLSLRGLFWIVGLLEVGVALVCLFGRHPGFSAAWVFWLSVSFLVYRLGSRWLGGPQYCNCLGTMTESLHLAPAAADLALKLALAYLLLGSTLALLISLRRFGFKGLFSGCPGL